MIDDRTPHFNLPLPNPDNLLQDDVLRLRLVIGAIDETLHLFDSTIQTLENNLADIREQIESLSA